MYVKIDSMANCYDYFIYNIRFDEDTNELDTSENTEEVSTEDESESFEQLLSSSTDSDGIAASIDSLTHVVTFWFLLWVLITCKRIIHKSFMKNTDEI